MQLSDILVPSHVLPDVRIADKSAAVACALAGHQNLRACTSATGQQRKQAPARDEAVS
jgi:hypothetical protein